MPRLSKIGAAALAAFGWTGLSSVTASYLQVAGGGGGGFIAGGNRGAGGGAGGFLTGTVSLNPTQSYTVTVGAGGTPLANGSNSQFGTLTASVGGGAGGSQNGASSVVGQNGGSGGGGPSQSGSGSTAGGTGTVGQGNDGAAGSNVSGQPYGCGGGGGAGAAGSLSNNPAGAGGVGLANPITGSTAGQLSGGIYYLAGGGGGGTYAAGGGVGGAGGLGGGGLGGGTTSANGVSGTANTGGGGGGAEYSSSAGASGGSGIVIISYVGAQQFGGGVVTSSGGNTIHTFTTSGTLSPLNALTANFLVVAGGGGGGGTYAGGGGGAGGFRSGTGTIIDTNSIYVVTVGSGGAGGVSISGVAGSQGGSSSVFGTTSAGGGGGGTNSPNAAGTNGGSGGGGVSQATTAGLGNTPATSPSQGNNGGTGVAGTNGSGGGGAGAVGGQTSDPDVGGNGGAGSASSISGSSVTYAGGGGGGGISGGGTGGSGGGGNGSSGAGSAGTANTGGGGGGSDRSPASAGGAGGSGVVIISYPGSTQQMAGGTVTVAGGNVIHTFTSSGYLAPIYSANNSLRFRGSASAKLSRTVTTSSAGTKGTFSAWIKRGKDFDSTNNGSLVAAADNYHYVQFYQQTVYFGDSTYYLNTAAVFRDPAAWYHIVAVVDTTQATSSDRMQIWVNGIRQTSGSFAVYPTLNYTFAFLNNAQTWYIGGRASDSFFDGYLADVNFIDGQALTPNSFGTFNGLGVWQPIRYGGSYGTNGFYLPFNAGTSAFAGSFNGSNQYLTLTSTSALVVASNAPFTLECFVYGNNFTATTQYPSIVTFPGGYQLYVNSGGSPFVSFFNGSSDVVTGLVKVGVWNHVAVARDGSGNISMWINGIRTSTATGFTNSFGSSSGTFLINSYDGSGGFVNGSVSNLRFVNGTAVYTPSSTQITVPTSNLTAVTNTALLTLQNATFVDNSTNAFSITNNNGATTGQTYPFGIGIFNDQGPAGNNWTPNNISGQFGTTLDSMTDVPTLTSATAANYCVMNPINSYSSITVNNGNLQLTLTEAAYRKAVATMAFPTTGTYYLEATVSGGIDYVSYGIVTPEAPLSDAVGQTATGYGAITGTTNWDRKNNGSTSGNFWTISTTNPTLQIAYDATNGKLWLGYNNTWLDSSGGVTGNPSAGTNQTFTVDTTRTYLPSFGGYKSNSIVINLNCGQRPFAYTPPTGFVRLNTFNLPTPTIGATASTTANKYFDVTLYTGTGSAGQVQTNSGLMQPDLTWIKQRNGTGGQGWWDAVRGATKYLSSQNTDAEGTSTVGVTSFNSNGFTVGSDSWTGGNTATYVGWQWRASNATAVTNTNGSINSTVSANTTAGFSIVTYTGNGTASTVGHGLSVAPSMIIVKRRDAGGSGWSVYFTTLPAGYVLSLQSSNGQSNSSGRFTTTLPTSSVFSVGTDSDLNGSGGTYVAYCFAPIAGYSAFGSYTGNGSSDGPFVFTGFRPRYVMIKRSDSTADWNVRDTSRSPYNVVGEALYPNLNLAEYSGSETYLDILSNGFKLRGNWNSSNASGGTYIYMAVAENPFKYSNAR